MFILICTQDIQNLSTPEKLMKGAAENKCVTTSLCIKSHETNNDTKEFTLMSKYTWYLMQSRVMLTLENKEQRLARSV